MKLTYNNGETSVTVEGTQDEVFTWYKTFVHSQQACEAISDTAFVGLINRKTSDDEVNKVVNDSRAGEPDEDGWMTWTATYYNKSLPKGLSLIDRVDFKSKYNEGTKLVSLLAWEKCSNEITKFRISK